MVDSVVSTMSQDKTATSNRRDDDPPRLDTARLETRPVLPTVNLPVQLSHLDLTAPPGFGHEHPQARPTEVGTTLTVNKLRAFGFMRDVLYDKTVEVLGQELAKDMSGMIRQIIDHDCGTVAVATKTPLTVLDTSVPPLLAEASADSSELMEIDKDDALEWIKIALSKVADNSSSRKIKEFAKAIINHKCPSPLVTVAPLPALVQHQAVTHPPTMEKASLSNVATVERTEKTTDDVPMEEVNDTLPNHRPTRTDDDLMIEGDEFLDASITDPIVSSRPASPSIEEKADSQEKEADAPIFHSSSASSRTAAKNDDALNVPPPKISHKSTLVREMKRLGDDGPTVATSRRSRRSGHAAAAPVPSTPLKNPSAPAHDEMRLDDLGTLDDVTVPAENPDVSMDEEDDGPPTLPVYLSVAENAESQQIAAVATAASRPATTVPSIPGAVKKNRELNALYGQLGQNNLDGQAWKPKVWVAASTASDDPAPPALPPVKKSKKSVKKPTPSQPAKKSEKDALYDSADNAQNASEKAPKDAKKKKRKDAKKAEKEAAKKAEQERVAQEKAAAEAEAAAKKAEEEKAAEKAEREAAEMAEQKRVAQEKAVAEAASAAKKAEEEKAAQEVAAAAAQASKEAAEAVAKEELEAKEKAEKEAAEKKEAEEKAAKEAAVASQAELEAGDAAAANNAVETELQPADSTPSGPFIPLPAAAKKITPPNGTGDAMPSTHKGAMDEPEASDPSTNPETPTRRRSTRTKTETTGVAHNEVRKALKKKEVKKKFDIADKLADPRFSNVSMIETMAPEAFNKEYYNGTGLASPLVFPGNCEGLGMVMVGREFDKYKIFDILGPSMRWQVTAPDNKLVAMSTEELREYYKKGVRDVPLNALSLDFSTLGFGDMVESPTLVRETDMVGAWPDCEIQRSIAFEPVVKKKKEDPNAEKWWYNQTKELYPAVTKFCLITAEGCYSDFHVDFGGTSVWYHVHTGVKDFFIVEPTPENLEKFKDWYSGRDYKGEFFGDVASSCSKVTLTAGNTLILPAGWIHAVFTPEDSLVFGGNFLHVRGIAMQLYIQNMEEERNETLADAAKDDVYPLVDQTAMYYIAKLVKEISGRCYVRPATRRKLNEPDENNQMLWSIEYVGIDFLKNKELLKEQIKECRYHAVTGLVTYKMEEDDDYVKYQAEEKKLFKKKDLCKYTTPKQKNAFYLSEKLFFHPECMGMDAKTIKRGEMMAVDEEPEVKIDPDVLRATLTTKDVEQLRLLVTHLREKAVLNVAKGITKTNSLLNYFEKLLNDRENLETGSSASDRKRKGEGVEMDEKENAKRRRIAQEEREDGEDM